jgi:S1/P1 Nuclease
MKKYFITIGFLLLTTISGFSWGAAGHRAIAAAAFQRLNPATLKAVSEIMSNSTVPELQTLDTAATWPDDIRLSSIPSHSGILVKNHNPAALDFNSRFATNHLWHFINYPLEGTYSPNGHFSSSEDVAHVIGHCIEVLEGTAQGKWSAMHKDEALAWLIHLVGDIHQPLHVGEGFYEFDGNNALLITDPTLAWQNRTHDDSGANDLYYTKSEEFHAFWDTTMVSFVSPNQDQLVQKILDIISAAQFSNGGDYHLWANKWATQSIHAAKEAYSALVTGDDNYIGTRRSTHGSQIDITLDTKGYKTQYEYLVKQQLGLAAFNLSELLNHIQWQ